MARRRKVALLKGPKRVKYENGEPIGIEQTLFCGECDHPTQAATIRRNPEKAKREGLEIIEEVARACMNSQDHKNGKNYLWEVGETVMPTY